MPDFSPSRPQDAYFVIRGYVYQVQLSIRRWLALQNGEVLELECGEDIDRLSQQINFSSDGSDATTQRERLLEQIKCHQDNVTLTSARMTLANFDAHRRTNAGRAIALHFRYTTNSHIGKENPRLLPSFEEGAISVWQKVADGTMEQSLVPTALRELREALLEFKCPTDGTSKPAKSSWDAFHDTIQQSDETQMLAFVRAFEWSTGSDAPLDLTAALQEELKVARWARSDEEAAQAHRKLFLHVFELLSKRGQKRLTPEDLERCLAHDASEQQARLADMVDFLFDLRSYLEERLDSLEINIRTDIASTGAGVKAHIDQRFEMQSHDSAVRQRLDDVKELLRQGKWLTAQGPLKLARQEAARIGNQATRNGLMCQVAGSEGICKWHEGSLQEAQDLFEEALRYQQDSAPALEHVAMMLVESDPAQARVLAEKARSDAETWPQASATWLRAIHRQEGWEGVLVQVQSDLSLKRNARCAQALGELALKNQLFDEALSYAEIGTREEGAPHALRLLADVLIAPVVKESDAEQKAQETAAHFVDSETGRWSQLALERLQRAAGLLDKAIQQMQTWEVAHPRAQAMAQRGAIFYQLGECEQAEKEIAHALVEDGTIPQARFLKALLAARSGATTTAINAFDDLRSTAPDEEMRFQAALLGGKLLLSEQRWAEVVKWLAPLWHPESGKRELIDVADCLLQSHQELHNWDDTRLIQPQLEEHYAHDPVAWAVSSQQATRERKPHLALKRMEEAWKMAQAGRWYKELRHDIARDLAGQHAARDHYKRAAVLLAPVARANVRDDTLANFLICLHRVGRNEQALKLAREARDGGRAIFPISLVEAEISATLGDIELAVRLRREIQEQFPENIRNVLDLAYLESLRGDVLAARQTVEAIPIAAIADKPYRLLEVAQARASFGLPDALEYGYRARKLAMDEADIHVGYAMLCNALSPKDSSDPLLGIEQVGEECAVHVRWRGNTDILVLTRHPITEVPDPRQVPLSDPRARLLLGKKIGNRVQLRSRGTSAREDPHEIVAIQSKYIFALHETTELFAQGVLQHERFQVNRFEPGNPEEMLEQMRDFLRANHDSSQFLHNFYYQQAAPLSTIAQLRGRALLECWRGGFGNQFFVSEGTGEELDEAHAAATEARKGGSVVLDETAILSLVHTETEDVAVAAFSKLLVPQVVRDEFAATLSRAEKGENALGFVYGDGDTIGFQQLTDEDHAADLEFWRRALKFVDYQTEVVPVYSLTRLAQGEAEIYTRPTLAAALLAHERGCPLWSDDLRVRRWAKQSRKVPGFWTNALLLERAESHKIPHERYLDALRRLILAGHVYLPISGGFLMWVCRRNGWQITPEVQAIFGVLSFAALRDQPAAGIAADFLRLLQEQPISLAVKRDFHRNILHALAKDRSAVMIFGFLEDILFLQALRPKRHPLTSRFRYYLLSEDVKRVATEILLAELQNLPQTQVIPPGAIFTTKSQRGFEPLPPAISDNPME